MPECAGDIFGKPGGQSEISTRDGRRQQGQAGAGAILFAMFVCILLNASMLEMIITSSKRCNLHGGRGHNQT